ncbi:Hypothetical protein FKW44_003605 [Caligus rogercresseyi]|uniref:Uncharacterized protein n=1 Tax=Caligus rogercresseyi TaxID=217165 RepID=A0A7T8KM50_CALRO|nr:Hypothetical protein FKW44_003605 [Caligus rogercresseyi]
MEEEKGMQCSLPSGREESKRGDRVLQLPPNSTVYDHGRLGTLSKRMMLIAKAFSVPGGHQDRRVCPEVKRKVNEDGNKVLRQAGAEMGCSMQTIANTINNLGLQETQAGCLEKPPLPLEPGLVAYPSSP